MKILNSVILAFFVSFLFSCTTGTRDKSYTLAEANQFDMTLFIVGSKDALKSATMESLSARRWNFSKEGDAIRASIDHRGVSGRLFITFDKDAVNINSRGSNISGTPIVPLRLIDNLEKSIRKSLISFKK